MLPILFQNPDFTLYSYPLLMGLGWGVGYQIFLSLIPESFRKWEALFIFWGIFIFSWIGAKALFILTIPEQQASLHLREISFWTGGGFVFYGGFLGALLFLLLYRMLWKKLDASVLWAMIPALSIGHAIGRVGCFLAGCCFGEPTDFFWGIHLHGEYRHPTQLLEALGLFALGLYLLKSAKPKKVLIIDYLLAYGLLRLFIESLRGDLIRGQWGPLTPSQWISLALIAVGGVLYIAFKNRRLKYSN